MALRFLGLTIDGNIAAWRLKTLFHQHKSRISRTTSPVNYAADTQMHEKIHAGLMLKMGKWWECHAMMMISHHFPINWTSISDQLDIWWFQSNDWWSTHPIIKSLDDFPTCWAYLWTCDRAPLWLDRFPGSSMAFSRRVEEEIVGISVGYQWEISGKSLGNRWEIIIIWIWYSGRINMIYSYPLVNILT